MDFGFETNMCQNKLVSFLNLFLNCPHKFLSVDKNRAVISFKYRTLYFDKCVCGFSQKLECMGRHKLMSVPM